MTGTGKILGTTRVRGVALILRGNEAEESFQLSWVGNGLDGQAEFYASEAAGKAWTTAIAALRENAHEDPVFERAPTPEMAI